MTTNTPAPAQEVRLTDDEIRSIWVEHGLDDEAVEDFGRAIESALLSKLRAPVADERAAFEHWLQHDVDPATISYDHTELTLARAAWQERGRRAALASAPVAGKAPTDDEIIDMAVEPLGIDCDRMPYGVVIFARALLARYAAPQASEAVRDAALEEAADFAAKYIRKFGPGGVATAIRALKSQTAALSAQPGAQKGGSQWQQLADALAKFVDDIPTKHAGEWLQLSGRIKFDAQGVSVSGMALAHPDHKDGGANAG